MSTGNDRIATVPEKVLNAADVGFILRKRRKELGYTQEQFGALVGMSPRLVGEIERGKETVGIQKVMNFATALGIDMRLTVRGSK